MLVDFQIATSSLADLIQRAVENRIPTLGDLGAPRYLPELGMMMPPPGTAPPPNHVVDHVRIESVTVSAGAAVATEIRTAAGTVLATVDRRRPKVEIIVRCPFASLARLERAGLAGLADSELRDIRLRVTFALDAALAGGRPELSLSFVSVELGLGAWFPPLETLIAFGVDPAVLDEIAAQLRGVEQRTVIDTTAITAMFSSTFQFWNAGLTLANGSLTIRLHYEPEGAERNVIVTSAAVGAWTTFYGTGPRDRRGTDPWGLFISGSAFEELLEERLRGAFAGMTDTLLMPDRPPHATWGVAGGRPRVTAECGVTSVRACEPFGIDIHGTLRVRLDLSTPRPSIMRLDLHYDTEPYWGEVIGCVALSTLAGGFVGMVIGGTFANIPGAIVGAIVGALAGMIGSIIGLAARGGGAPSIGGFTAVPGTTSDFFAEQRLVIPGGDVFGDLAFTTIVPDTEGLRVGGTFGTVAVDRRARLALDRVPSGFAWAIDGSCARWSVMAVADAGGRNEGNLPMAVYRPTVLGADGRPDTTSPYVTMRSRIDRPRGPVPVGGRLTLSNRVSADAVLALHEAAATPTPPYKLLIATSGGARIITVPGIDASLTFDAHERAAATQRLSCAAQRLEEQLHGARRRPFPQPHPLIDPVGPAEWVLRIAGLAKGDAIRFVDEHGTEVARSAVDKRGIVDVRWFQMRAPAALSWEPVAGDGRDMKAMLDAKVEVGAARASFVRHATVALGGPVGHLALAHHEGRPHLVAVSKTGLHVFSLANPSVPALVDEREVAGLEGATILGGDLVAWSGDKAYRSPLGGGAGGKVEELSRGAVEKMLGGVRLSLASVSALQPKVDLGAGEAEPLPIHLGELGVALDKGGQAVTVLGLESVAH